MTEFESFITSNADTDTARLMLSCRKWPVPEGFASSTASPKDLAVNTIEARKKLRKKLPELWSETRLIYPTVLCAEQCSSSATAACKASLADRILKEDRNAGRLIADLTGGLGADSMAFAKVAEKVLYNEMNPLLAEAARHNFRILGISNIEVSCAECRKDSLREILGEKKPGIIFLDPGRRGDKGNKVFMLEDCQPNVLELLPSLFEYSKNILLKLSPMADITMVRDRLNRSYNDFPGAETASSASNADRVREIHVVSCNGECKELLIWMDRDWREGPQIICSEDGNALVFSQEEISSAKPVLTGTAQMKMLFEPGKSLTKAGAVNAFCNRFGLAKLGKSTNLCTSAGIIEEEPALELEKELKPYGKVFSVTDVLPFNKASIKAVKKEFPHSEVSAKNFPLSSDELRARLGVSSGNDAMIFGAKIGSRPSESNFLIICSPMPKG